MRKVVYPTFYYMFFMFLPVPTVGYVIGKVKCKCANCIICYMLCLLVEYLPMNFEIYVLHGGIGPPWEHVVDIYILFPFCTLYLCINFILSLLIMPKAWGHAFSEGRVCDNYGFPGNSGPLYS